MFDNENVSDLLIYLSRIAVFDKEFTEILKDNLDLLATVKKLKYFTNLTLGQNAILFKNMGDYLEKPLFINEQIDKLFTYDSRSLADVRFKDHMKKAKFAVAQKYLDNDEALIKIDPHSVYPTSIYRHCDGVTIATPDSQTIEAVMSTNITTTIKITRGILDPKN